MADLNRQRERRDEELHVSAHPSAQFRVRARQGRAGLGLCNNTIKQTLLMDYWIIYNLSKLLSNDIFKRG